MMILGIDSSGLVASVALVKDGEMIGEYTINYKKTHSQTLLPMLDEMAKMIELDMNEVDAIAVAAGPGSFTGLRIGSATAKGLALALKKPIISISTLEALAYNMYETNGLVCPIMDARRNQVYTAIYRFENGKMQEVWEPKAVAVDELIEKLNELNEEVIFTGDGMPVYKEKLAENLQVKYLLAPAHLARQRAGALASLGSIYFEEGRYTEGKEHQPVYLRLSQAEREMMEKEAKKADKLV